DLQETLYAVPSPFSSLRVTSSSLLVPAHKMLKAARASDIVAPLAVLGAFTAIKGFCGLSSALFKTFLRPGKDLRKRGEWAIITGASDGIGKAYALELAKKGLSVLLISRTIEKLEAAANEIKQACPEVTVQCLAVDFNSFDAEAQAMISSSLCGKDIGVLINNVGYTAPPLHLQYLSMAQINSLVQVNLMSTVLMTQAVLPAMTQQGRGAIVNTASGFGCMPSPLFSLYGATKAAIIRLSGALAVELEGKGISVQCQVPCMVATKMGSLLVTQAAGMPDGPGPFHLCKAHVQRFEQDSGGGVRRE
ncbi:unnamed protein product, partial [Chrysoparadoxa australica]